MYEDIATVDIARVATLIKGKTKLEHQRQAESNRSSQISKLFCTSFESRIGRIYVASSEKGVCKVSVPNETHKDFFSWLQEHFDTEGVIDNRSRNKEVIDQLTRYFHGKLVKFNLPLDLVGTPFQIRIWKELARIPYGSTITYRSLARKVSTPNAFQAVGRANASNPLPIIIPCHRVIGSDGSLVGYSCGIKTKEFLLRLEGAIIL